MTEPDLHTLKLRELKEARFLWQQKYEQKYIKKFGTINTKAKELLFLIRCDEAYFQNNKLKKIRNELYKLKGCSFREKLKPNKLTNLSNKPKEIKIYKSIEDVEIE